MGNDYVCYAGCSSSSRKKLENSRSAKNQPQRTIRQWFDVTKKLITDQTEIQSKSMIDWHTHAWQRTTLLLDKAVQLSTAKVYVFSGSLLCLGQMNPHLWVIDAWKIEIWVVYRYSSISRVGTNRRGANGIRVDKIHRIHYITDSRRDPENDERNTVWTSAIFRTNHLHDNVQWHCMGRKRKQRIMYCEFRRICKKIRARTLVVSRTWIRKEMVRAKHVQAEWRMGWCRWTHVAQL